jgi:hypothetical protein
MTTHTINRVTIHEGDCLQRFETMPDGWRLDSSWGSPVSGYAPICDGVSRLRGGRKGLLKIAETVEEPAAQRPAQKPPETPKAVETVEDAKATAWVQNELARAQMKHRLMADLLMDLRICQLEGWPADEYVCGLKELIDEAFEKVMKRKPTLKQGVLF